MLKRFFPTVALCLAAALSVFISYYVIPNYMPYPVSGVIYISGEELGLTIPLNSGDSDLKVEQLLKNGGAKFWIDTLYKAPEGGEITEFSGAVELFLHRYKPFGENELIWRQTVETGGSYFVDIKPCAGLYLSCRARGIGAPVDVSVKIRVEEEKES